MKTQRICPSDKFQGRLDDLQFTSDGKQLLTIMLDSDFRQQFLNLYDSTVDITVKKHRERRSLDANGYAWVLIDKIAEKRSMSKTEVYQNAIREIGGVSDVVCVQNKAVPRLRQEWSRNGLGWQTETMESKIPGCTVVVLYYGSSTYDTAQMSRLIDSLVQDAQSLGIETRSPKEIEQLLEQFECVEGVT